MELERRVYSSWAFSENEKEKSNINREIYKDLKDKCAMTYDSKLKEITDEMKKQKAYLLFDGHGYAHVKYRILSNPNNLSTSELALFCDNGNLCFGYRTSGNTIIVHTD